MKFLLVGGAVRDELLGRDRSDRDWLILGADHDALLSHGFRAVGQHFTVYLHPDTHEEYALPRGPEAPSDEGAQSALIGDLERRDFTINAMARDSEGQLHDPFGGCNDLAERQVRHVRTEYFVQDPLRHLRASRLAATFGFSIAPETRLLIRNECKQGALRKTAPERLYTELLRGLGCGAPSTYLRHLRTTGALNALLPEVEELFGIPQVAKYHPEIDTGIHVGLALDYAASQNAGDAVMFSVLVHDLGKALTEPTGWPQHIGHEALGLPRVEAICERLKVPVRVRKLALAVTEQHLNAHRAPTLRAGKVLSLLERVGGFGQGSFLHEFLCACECDARGRLGLGNRPYAPHAYLLQCAKEASRVSNANVADKGLSGPEIGQAIRDARIQTIGKLRRANSRSDGALVAS